ncbi:hypothetical protein DBR17_02650 [Sphingomonas sp. HMWF008]|nr:hypothetical protein DBR17_02650 [Sphingomonas sp. HMWF008]
MAALLCLAALQACSAAAPANIYAATPATIFAILDQMDIPTGPQGPLGTLDITKAAVEPKSISWTGAGAHATITCTATLVPLDPARTQVAVACHGGEAGADGAAAKASDLARIAMIEQVDSTLRGRPFNWETVQVRAGPDLMKTLPQMQVEPPKPSAATPESQPSAQGEMPSTAPGEPSLDPTAGQSVEPVARDPHAVTPLPVIN